MFVGRERELNTLRRQYQSNRFEFTVIYGRRRIGKTALIREFIRDRRAVYFTGIESSIRQNLENLSRALLEFGTGLDTGSSFSSFQAALEYAFRMAQKERLVLVIDEYPYVARADRTLSSVLQRLIDEYRDGSYLMLILCGSSMSYMEDEVLAYKAPLYGRRTAQMKLEPLEFGEVCRCFSQFKVEDLALIYGIAGGTPQYLLQMSDERSVEENIRENFLDPSSFLYEEPTNLLKQEVREAGLYAAIISAIASGAGRMSEIASAVGIDSAAAVLYLKNLQSLGLIRRETPYGEKASRRSIYVIEDNMFRFWYRFVPPNQSLIARGAQDQAWQRIAPRIPDYMGAVFEKICAQFLWHLLLQGKSPVQFRDLGRWWGNNPILHQQEEIDIMGEQDAQTALFAECKWTSGRVGTEVLETLRRRSGLFHYSRVVLVLFAKSGFTDACTERASQMGDVVLVTYEDILRELSGAVESKDAAPGGCGISPAGNETQRHIL